MPGAVTPHEITLSEAARETYTERTLAQPDAASSFDLTAFVSCYDEAEFIEETLETIRSALSEVGVSYEIIIIDDCSRDNSAEQIRRYIARHPQDRIMLRRNPTNKGLAQNFVDGAFLSKGRYYKLFCGDNTEPHDSIVKICKLIGRADIIIPNYSSVESKSGFRKLLSRAYTTLINFASGYRLGYYNGLSVHLRFNVMRWHPNTRGFGFQADIICMLLDQGATYLEVDVPAINRRPSRALTWRNILSVLHTLTDIVIRRFARQVYGG
jgi:glycosyltransferase involved in cell wall biosynthesis